jgi:CRISPR-associated protein Csm5
MAATVQKFVMRVLSPVHVGCDEVYEPMSFVVDQEQSRMILFDPLDFFTSLEEKDRNRFSDICRSGGVRSILELYKFLKGRQANGREVALCSGFLQHYEQTLGIPLSDEQRIKKELNEFSAARTAFLSYDQRPYLPGSGIKGSMRTAYLNSLTARANVRIDVTRARANSELEQRLLNLDPGFQGITQDPFRLLKISDFMPVGDVKTRIVYAVNEKKAPSKYEPSGPYQVLEVIEPGALFIGTIGLESPERGSHIRSQLSMKPVIESLNAFFRDEKAREDGQLTAIGVGVDAEDRLNGSHLLRVGRHSGAECVTVEGYRRIKIMKPRSKEREEWKPEATTLWLAAESRKPRTKTRLQPFGWIALEPLGKDRERELDEIERAWRLSREQSERARLAEGRRRIEAAQDTARRAAEDAELLRLEQERLKEKEARRQAELAGMSEGERAVERLRSPRVNEADVVAVYQRIDEFENKHGVAAALKEYWIRVGKWTKKECSPKQLKKVATIKAILGE